MLPGILVRPEVIVLDILYCRTCIAGGGVYVGFNTHSWNAYDDAFSVSWSSCLPMARVYR